METLPAPSGLATGQTSLQGGSEGAALGRPKKPRPVVMRRICPRRSGPNWQESMRNRWYRGKQMTADACRLMRPGAAVQGSTARATTDQYCQAGLNSRVSLSKAVPYEGLSRMKGNFHVRFLGGRGRATARAYPASPVSLPWLSPAPTTGLAYATGVPKGVQIQDSSPQRHSKCSHPGHPLWLPAVD
jgi:hypothetical protein